MKKTLYKIILIFSLFFIYFSCCKSVDTIENSLDGKLKSITFYDSTITSTYNLNYDTITGNLKSIDIDTIGNIIYTKYNNTIIIESNFIGKGRRVILAFINAKHKIETIKELDTNTNTESVIYILLYNNFNSIDTLTEPDKLFFTTDFKSIIDFNFIKIGDNYSFFKKAFIVENFFGGSTNYDTLSYQITYTGLVNNNQIPLQEPTSYTPFYYPLCDIELLSLYDNSIFQFNKNLINNISIANGADTSYINYEYFYSGDKVEKMLRNGRRIFSFTYY